MTAELDILEERLGMAVQEAWELELAKERNQHPKRLRRHGFKVYSQSDEDGLLQEIFRRVGVTDRRFIEFGVETGVECNTAKLLVEGWEGLWIEADPKHAKAIDTGFAPFLGTGQLSLIQSRVTVENVNELFRQGGMHESIDLLSIDIDSNDFWVWKAVTQVRSRVVVIEYNASLRPPMSLTVSYDPDRAWGGTSFYGASLEALVRLGASLGYKLVGCSLTGANAFFVRDDLTEDKFVEPATAEEHYEPPRFWFRKLPVGHTPRPGPFVQIGS